MLISRCAPRVGWLIGLLFLAGTGAAHAQQRGVGVSYGRWWHDDAGAASVFTIVLSRSVLGPFQSGFGFITIDDRRTLTDRSLSGGELSLALGSVTGGPFAVAAGAVGIRHTDGSFDGHWSAGAGYGYQPWSFLQLGVEARYRVEDQFVRGFWRLNRSDRRGLSLQAALSLRFGGPRRTIPTRGPIPIRAGRGENKTAGPGAPPSTDELDRIGREAGASNDDARVAASIVETAVNAMGSPYRWGGTDANGFDCSGLIQYAYGQHGILLPRISRDQARTGLFVEKRMESLRPGDILIFAADGNGVSHVGMYVGDGQFIHSSSTGVRLSSLTTPDGDSQWWQQRWVGARRILA